MIQILKSLANDRICPETLNFVSLDEAVQERIADSGGSAYASERSLS